MTKTITRLLKILLPAVLIVLLLVYFTKWTLIILTAYIIFGLLDLSRNDTFNLSILRRYFIGNGILTWALSPFNLGVDLLSRKNKGIYQLQDLPENCQKEINTVIATLTAQKDQIVSDLNAKLESKRRGMLFFKWYGRNISDLIPDFTKDFKHIKTIGISVFNKKQSTSRHFGPLRLTFRVLYNMTPMNSDDVFIEVGKVKHLWYQNPFFIFDDTLMHRSVNGIDHVRYCVFIDILRPSPVLGVLDTLLKAVQFVFIKINRLFYKNWDFLKI